MGWTTLVHKIDVFDNGAGNNSFWVFVLIFQSPNAIESVHFADTSTILIRPLEISLQFRLIFQAVAGHKIP